MATSVLNRMPWAGLEAKRPEQLLDREWLVTNGLGGYASGSVSGAATRRYHGLLIAALPAPFGRTMMLNHLSEELRLSGGAVMRLGAAERPEGGPEIHGERYLTEFRLETGLPVWHFEGEGFSLEKRVLLSYQQNTVFVLFTLLAASGRVRLRLRPSLHFRPHDASVAAPLAENYKLDVEGQRIQVCRDQLPPLKMFMEADSGALVLDRGRVDEIFCRVEHGRGYDARGHLWSPGYFRTDLEPGQQVALVASTEPWDVMSASKATQALEAELTRRSRLIAMAAPEARTGAPAELVLAADQFLVKPNTRSADEARAHATGDEIRTIIAGYHWFTDWGRDTMISLEGLTLTTGRHVEAGWVLRTCAQLVRDGLIPNLFPEGQHEGLYHTADATLWFFHAVERYVLATDDRATLRQILPKFEEIIEAHLRGTRFGIHVDPTDGLLMQGAAGYQLTWMDAKVDDWVVTPRRGKAVEINALWFNALCLMEKWLRQEGKTDRAETVAAHAALARRSFNERFWYEPGCYLFDVVDGEQGDDASLRPNQIFAISLDHPVLESDRWLRVLQVVTERLLTPMGLRSLAPGETDYKPRYDGDLRSRDAAYHQGTVWGWLAGPFVDAWLKVHPGDLQTAQDFLEGFVPHLGEACIGSISEIFDAEAPYTPRGCIAQAWSVAEVLRAWVKVARSTSDLADPPRVHTALNR